MFILLTLLAGGQFCSAQHINDQMKSFGWDLSADAIADSTVKAEIALFKLTHTVDPSKFVEIPLKRCDNKGVFFSKGSTYIDLYFKKDEPDRADATVSIALDSIFVVLHSHYLVPLPRGSFEKIINTPPCEIKPTSKRSVDSSPFYKAFTSKDGKRIYIYISGGPGGSKYDAIWVVVNGYFYARAFDLV